MKAGIEADDGVRVMLKHSAFIDETVNPFKKTVFQEIRFHKSTEFYSSFNTDFSLF